MNKIALTLLLIGTSTFTGCGTPETPKAAPSAPPAKPTAEVSHPASTAETPVPAIDVATLALKIDPVCKMSLEEYPATGTAVHEGKTYGFCSEFCKKKFVADPEKMLARLAPAPASTEAQP